MRELPDPYILAFLLLVGALLLLAYNRLVTAVRGICMCFRGMNGTMEMLGNKAIGDSVRIVFLLLLPFYALALDIADISTLGYVWMLMVLVSICLFRKAVYRLIGWLSSRQAAFRSLEKMGNAFWLLVMLASAPAILLGWLVPDTPRWLLWTLLALPACAGSFFYVRRGSSLILQTEFSLFFWVLYLCALEFLPICVVVNILINGN